MINLFKTFFGRVGSWLKTITMFVRDHLKVNTNNWTHPSVHIAAFASNAIITIGVLIDNTISKSFKTGMILQFIVNGILHLIPRKATSILT